MNKIIHWCFFLSLLGGHHKALAFKDEVINQQNLMKILKSNKEIFHHFDLSSYKKWLQLFLIYASDTPKHALRSLEPFKKDVCNAAKPDQKNTCSKIFKLMAEAINKPQVQTQFQSIALQLHKDPKSKASFLEKILKEEQDSSDHAPVISRTAQGNQTEQSPKYSLRDTDNFRYHPNRNAISFENPLKKQDSSDRSPLNSRAAQGNQAEKTPSTLPSIQAEQKTPSNASWFSKAYNKITGRFLGSS